MTGSKKALAFFGATPFLMFLAAETVTGNLMLITPAGFILNLVLYYLIYLGVWIIFGTSRGTWPVLNFLIYALAAGEYFVISFRERPIMIWDALALKTAMTVSTNYKFALTPRLIFMFLAAVILGIAAVRYPVRLKFSGDKKRTKRLGALGAYGTSCVLFGGLLFGVLEKPLDLGVQMWDPIVNFEKEGFLLSTVLSMKNLIPEKPVGYDRQEAEKLLAEMGEDAGAEEQIEVEQNEDVNTPVNVICIMNESFSDLGIYNNLSSETFFETDQEYLSYFHGLTENTEKGDLYVPVFGAMTANTEYEFLTGNSCALAPQGSVPFQFYTKPGDDSLARIFGENGYRTVAMHPYPGYNWNRTKAYENLGFDEFLDLAYYEELGKEIELDLPRGYMSDKSDYDGIIRVIESKAPGEKLFLFNVTMQNHGGYEVDGLKGDVHVTALNGSPCAEMFPKTEQYLTLMKMSDEALAYLLEYFKDWDETTMIVLFGDHQPSVETSFFEALYGERWSQVPGEQKITSFQTPYLIWTNYDRQLPESRGQSAFMLGNDVLKTAGIPLTGYRYWLEQVREEFSAVHSMGILDRGGQFTDIASMDSLDDRESIRRLHILQYHRMFEK